MQYKIPKRTQYKSFAKLAEESRGEFLHLTNIQGIDERTVSIINIIEKNPIAIIALPKEDRDNKAIIEILQNCFNLGTTKQTKALLNVTQSQFLFKEISPEVFCGYRIGGKKLATEFTRAAMKFSISRCENDLPSDIKNGTVDEKLAIELAMQQIHYSPSLYKSIPDNITKGMTLEEFKATHTQSVYESLPDEIKSEMTLEYSIAKQTKEQNEMIKQEEKDKASASVDQKNEAKKAEEAPLNKSQKIQYEEETKQDNNQSKTKLGKVMFAEDTVDNQRQSKITQNRGRKPETKIQDKEESRSHQIQQDMVLWKMDGKNNKSTSNNSSIGYSYSRK